MPDITTKAESTLSAKTDVNKTDSVRLVGTDDHSYKSSVGDLAKCVLEECNVSSLAGSTQTPKAAIDALNSNFAGVKFVSVNTSVNTAKVFNVGASYRGLLFLIDSDVNRCGAYIFYTNGSSNANCIPIKEATAVTIDKSTSGQISFTSTGATRILFIMAAGVPVAV